MEHIKSAIYAPVVERQSRATRVWKAYHRMIVTLIATTSPPWLLFSSLFSLLNVLGMDAVWPRLVLTCFPLFLSIPERMTITPTIGYLTFSSLRVVHSSLDHELT